MRTLTMTTMPVFLLTLLAACGGGDSSSATPGESEGEEAEAEAEGEGGREGEGEEAEAEGEEAESEAESEAECEPQECEDKVDCTEDAWNERACQCEYTPLHGRCDPPLICDPVQGCVRGEACGNDADCRDLDDGPCLQEFCQSATASCAWRPLDNDEDGFSPQICAKTLGIDREYDCDDSDSFIYPSAPESCNGLDDSCSGEIDDLAAQVCGSGFW